MHWTTRSLFTLLPLVFAACGGLDPDPDGLSPEQYVDGLLERTCEAAVDCAEYPDVESCVLAIRNQSSLTEIPGLVERGTVVYDEEMATDCLEQTSAPACGELYLPLAPGCPDVFTGAVPVGEACSSQSECVPGARCWSDCPVGSCCAGQCLPFSDENPWLCGDVMCDEDSYCDANDTCVPLPGPGELCFDYQCRSDAACDYESMRCERLGELGDPCQPNLINEGCRWGHLECDADTTTCVLKPGPGEPCEGPGFRANCRSENLQCEGGVCEWLPSLGESCVPLYPVDGGYPRCLSMLECGDGLCMLPHDECP